MYRFLFLVIVVLQVQSFCSFGQEDILVGKKYDEIISYVSKNYKSYVERTYNDNITLAIEARDKNNDSHVYRISFKTNKCISHSHLYSNKIDIINTLHIISTDFYIVEQVEFTPYGYLKHYYEYVRNSAAKKREIFQRVP